MWNISCKSILWRSYVRLKFHQIRNSCLCLFILSTNFSLLHSLFFCILLYKRIIFSKIQIEQNQSMKLMDKKKTRTKVFHKNVQFGYSILSNTKISLSFSLVSTLPFISLFLISVCLFVYFFKHTVSLSFCLLICFFFSFSLSCYFIYAATSFLSLPAFVSLSFSFHLSVLFPPPLSLFFLFLSLSFSGTSFCLYLFLSPYSYSLSLSLSLSLSASPFRLSPYLYLLFLNHFLSLSFSLSLFIG